MAGFRIRLGKDFIACGHAEQVNCVRSGSQIVATHRGWSGSL